MTGMLFLLMLPAAASAYEFDYLFEFGVENNSNVNLSETDPQSSNILEPAFGFNVKQEGSTVQATANGLVQYRDYLDGEFSDAFRGQLAGHLNWTMVPERLNLTVEDYAGVQPINELQPDTPNNEQQTNVFAIGPTLNFRLGATVRGEAELRYINSYAEKTDEFNSNRLAAAVRAIKDLSATSTISANVTDQRVNYTQSSLTTGPDYNRYAAFGRYTEKWTKIDLTADLGYSWLHYTDRLDNRDSPLARATLSWHYSDRSTFGLNAAYQYSDAASDMMIGADIPTIPTNIATGDATVTSQPYLERDLAVTYAYTGDRLGFNFAPYYQKLDYSEADPTNIGLLGAAQNQTGKGALAGLTYLLRPLLSIGVTATGENLRYDTIDRVDKTWTIAAYLRQQWTRNWSWRVQLSHYDRNSTEPGQSSHQNVAYFAITYTR
jgi:hypothetical protein